MNGINEVLLLGTVGSDPETKIISESARVSTFRLATNETFTGKDGVKKEFTEWHSVEAWNFLSDTIANYVRKGTHIIVRGKIKTDTYDDKEVAGRKISRTKIVMDNIHFLPGNKKPEGQNGQVIPQQQVPAYQQQPAQHQVPAYQQQPAQQQAPVYQQQPIQQPPYQQQAPAYQQQPAQQQVPAYQQQPIQQPPYQAPVQQIPVQQQPSVNQQQPIQQAQQQVNTYMTDEQFLNNMSTPDDLPF